jgi:hypothetical protein
MGAKLQKIEVDEATAATLEQRAARRGVSVAQLVAELVPLSADDDELAELDRRWEAIKNGEPTIPHEEVERWLRTWGTADFRPWNER